MQAGMMAKSLDHIGHGIEACQHPRQIARIVWLIFSAIHVIGEVSIPPGAIGRDHHT
ncbi:hypothetical protein D3C84_1213810 [compost metagenome]